MTATAPPDPHPDSPPTGPEQTPDQTTPETEPGRESVEDVPEEEAVLKQMNFRNALQSIRPGVSGGGIGQEELGCGGSGSLKLNQVVGSFLAKVGST